MKSLQKFILPALIIAVVILIYSVYFAPTEELGSFKDFDPNNSAVKDIKVMIVPEKGINKTGEGGATFYVSDKNDDMYLINADKIPENIQSASVIVLRGHLSSNNTFHAHDVLIQ